MIRGCGNWPFFYRFFCGDIEVYHLPIGLFPVAQDCVPGARKYIYVAQGEVGIVAHVKTCHIIVVVLDSKIVSLFHLCAHSAFVVIYSYCVGGKPFGLAVFFLWGNLVHGNQSAASFKTKPFFLMVVRGKHGESYRFPVERVVVIREKFHVKTAFWRTFVFAYNFA